MVPSLVRLFAAVVVVAACSGCASIVSGTNQSLSVVTAAATGSDLSGAKCSLSNDKGAWYVTSPGSVTVHRSFKDLTVNCSMDDVEAGTASVKSSTKGMAAGNLLFGGVIGVGVDVASGAAYDYPNVIRVTMGQPAGSPQSSLSGTASSPAPVPARPAPVAAAPLLQAGTRFTYRDADATSGGPLGESSYTVTSVGAGQISLNDGAIVSDTAWKPVKGAMHGTYIYGTSPEQIAKGGSWVGRFRVGSVTTDVPVDITFRGREVKVVSGRTFQAVRLGVDGYSSREVGLGSFANGSPFKGDMLVDASTGLVLELKVACRSSSYAVQRELINIASN